MVGAIGETMRLFDKMLKMVAMLLVVCVTTWSVGCAKKQDASAEAGSAATGAGTVVPGDDAGDDSDDGNTGDDGDDTETETEGETDTTPLPTGDDDDKKDDDKKDDDK
jgi:hypothetical protein